MSGHQTEIDRIQAEYRRRAREVPADRYSFALPDNVLRHAGVVRHAAALLKSAGLFPPSGADILDAGCGRGDWLLDLTRWGADPKRLHGIDLSAERVAEAHRRIPPADLRSGDASAMPWADGSFDLITQFTMFSSILDKGVRHAVAAEMLRVLRPGGCVLWYDIRKNNPSNSNVMGLDYDAVASLFPRTTVTWKTLTLAPPLARIATRISWTLAVLLETVPIFHSHALALIRKTA